MQLETISAGFWLVYVMVEQPEIIRAEISANVFRSMFPPMPNAPVQRRRVAAVRCNRLLCGIGSLEVLTVHLRPLPMLPHVRRPQPPA